jgi:hypothetical protein
VVFRPKKLEIKKKKTKKKKKTPHKQIHENYLRAEKENTVP